MSPSVSFGKACGAVVPGDADVAGCASAGVSVDRPHQPSQPDEVTGRCGVSAAGGGCLGAAASVVRSSFVSPVFRAFPLLSWGFDASGGPSGGGSCCAVATATSPRATSSLRPATFSASFGNDAEDAFAPSMLPASDVFLVSYLLKSAVFLGLDVPPCIVSFAIWVDADDLGTRGQEPYQLRVLWACEVGACLLGDGAGPSAVCWDSLLREALASSIPSCCEAGWEVAGVADTVVGAGVGVEVEALLACDVAVDCDGIAGGRLAEESFAVPGFGFARFRGAMVNM